MLKDFFQKQKYYIRAPIMLDIVRIFVGNGLATAPPEIWKKHRRVISSAFHFDCIKDMIPNVTEIASQSLENLKNRDMSRVDMMQVFQGITGDVIGRLFFGEKFDEYRIKGTPVTSYLAELGPRVGYEFVSPVYLLFGRKAVEAKILPRHKRLIEDIEAMNEFARNIIEKKIQEKKQKDYAKTRKSFIDVLLDTTDKAPEDMFSVQEIIDEFVTFVLAGMETTGHLVCMAVYYLSQNPQYKERLMEEINKYFKDPSQVNLDALNQMNFLTAFLKETLRFAAPAAILVDRVATEDHDLNGFEIKKGTLVNVNLILNNFNMKYHQHPEIFDPERWLQEDSKTKQSVAKDPYVFIPFSSGPNNCIGQHLAMNEAKVILSLFLKKFEFELNPGYTHKMVFTLIHEPGEKLNFKLTPKQDT